MASHTDPHKPPPGVPGLVVARAWVAALARTASSDSDRVDRIRALEDLKARAAAAQARLTADLDTSQRTHHADLRVPASEQGRGVAAQIGAARRESPHRGSQHLGLARVLVTELPHTLAAMETGVLSEWRATLVARETACLTLEHRQTIDADLFADPTRPAKTDGWGDRRLAAEVRKRAYTLDPHAVVDRARRAEAQRRVTLRPAPDTMAHLSALLPASQGIAVFAVLGRHADTQISAGDPRTRAQIMADTLVHRVTGQPAADAVPVEVTLTVSDETLLAAGTTPAWLHGYGPVPAGTARHLVARAVAEATATLRRLYVTPAAGTLVAMDSTARTFPAGLARFIDLRDQTCRTPWCDAPVRHRDHITSVAAGGQTTATNGQGLCVQCNHTKQAPGWTARSANSPPGQPHTAVTLTPTGHELRSTAPPLPSPAHHRPRQRPRVDIYLADDFTLAG